ncbi:SURF1 family protein [Pseudochelatococcus sp. B33]
MRSFPPRSLIVAGIGVLAVICGLVALGVWQVQRLSWKTDLIARIEARVHAEPVPAPGRAGWPAVTREGDEYRRVRLSGTFLHDRETLVQAVTELGAGFWVLTPLEDGHGAVTLINRGFVPSDRRAPETRLEARVDGPVTVTGLIRMSEPGGAFLRTNDPAGDRWYSRDVAAIAEARGLGSVAPYFLDADAGPDPGGYPRGGLTRLSFPNSHLAYALTWFAMAALAAGMFIAFARHAWRESEGDHTEP